MKVTIIGVGNIGGAIARGLANGSIFQASDITCTDMLSKNLDALKETNSAFCVSQNNATAIKGSDIIIIAVKPWKVESVVDEIKNHIDYENQLIVSIAAGVSFNQISAFFQKGSALDDSYTPVLFRVIPNIAIEVGSSMTFVASSNANSDQEKTIVDIFNELGYAMLIEENLMTAGTALASSGIAYALRYIRASMEGGVELGFYPNQAKEIVLNTMKGAVDLLLAHNSNPEIEIDKVTTPGGITIKGLNEMELSGFTSSVIRGLKASR